MAESTRILRQSSRTLVQPSANELILLHLDSGEYFALDEISAQIWQMCDGTNAVEAIVTAICREYDAPEATVRADVLELLEELERVRLLVEAS